MPIFTDIFTLNMSTVDIRWGKLFSQRGAHFHCKYEYPDTHILRHGDTYISINMGTGVPILGGTYYYLTPVLD